MLAPDPCRDLPDPSRTAKDAVTGTELNLYDDYYTRMTPELRLTLALDASLFGKRNGEHWTLVSEEAEYSDSVYDTFLVDSQGLRCRHLETSFEYGVEMTILDDKGNKYSKYWWDGTPMLKDLDINSCCPKALDLAVEMLSPKRHRTGRTRMVIDTECASRVVSPLLRALNAYSIQQNNSFLMDTAGKQVFPEGLTILDCGRQGGETGSRLFDSEGVATRTQPIIDKGTVCQYFVNTYMAGKTGLAPTIEDAEYKKELKRLQKRMAELHNIIYRKKIPVVLCYEGWDAAGKGGNIRRVAYPLDPRGFDVMPIASPEPHELARQYLWRFWTRIPRTGHICIFDRTWYGRVMVERLEGFCTENDWKRAYNEINEFERQLTDWGAVVLKFWIHIDSDTQLARFTDRQNTPEKQWKITDEDWRNREKWDLYEEAIDEMLAKTSTKNAPWYIIESNDKKYARIRTLKIIVDALEKACEGQLNKETK